MTMRKPLLLAVSMAVLFHGCRPDDGEYSIHILSTNDVHGTYFDTNYSEGAVRNSLFAVKHYADSIRAAEGEDNVLLLDAGDFLQGDNAAYYFNYVDTISSHVYSRIAEYMGYDAVIAGNHDIETGHRVYDRIAEELKDRGIPFLAGNAIRNDNGKRYFPASAIIRKNGLKIAVLGYDNANIKAWLDESLWSGMHFESLLPLVQKDVDKVIARHKPHIVVVAVHSGTGDGDGTALEDQGLDLYNSLEGVDIVVCSHDHKPLVKSDGKKGLINSGSHSRNIGHGTVSVSIKKHKVISRSVEAEIIPVDAMMIDEEMKRSFADDYEAVKAFTLREVGELENDMDLSDALSGMSDYINLIHSVCLRCHPAQLSIVAPLSTRGIIKAGTLIYDDLFKLYTYENQLFVVQLNGSEIKDYLEASYDQWIHSPETDGHILNIEQRTGTRTGQQYWAFAGPTYNLDTVGGLNYTVDVTQPYGSRIAIYSMADGSGFDPGATYNVAMTSYRASGGGGLLEKIGVDTDRIDERVVQKYPEIRELLYRFLQDEGAISTEKTGDPSVIGHWEFIPAETAGPVLEKDMKLLNGD